MPLWRDHEVWIETNGQRNKEYKVESNKNVITCFIASEAGKTFKIKWINHQEPWLISTAFVVRVDGNVLDTFLSHYASERKSGESEGYWVDATSCKPFKFSNVTFTDAENSLTVPSAEIGNIDVLINRVVPVTSCREYAPLLLPDSLRMPISETSKKVGSHRVDVDDNLQTGCQRRFPVIARLYDRDVKPLVFRFIYRPKEILQALEIMPIVQTVVKKRRRLPQPDAGPSNYQEEKTPKKMRQPSSVKKKSKDGETSQRTLLVQRTEISRKSSAVRKKKKSKKSVKAKKEETSVT